MYIYIYFKLTKLTVPFSTILQKPHNRLSISKDECISIPGSAMKSSRERVKRKDGTREAGKGRLVVDKDFQGEDEPGMGIKQGGH